eukprot:scaffold22642_cov134-Cylindrotheca_fusiformis.AAC.9
MRFCTLFMILAPLAAANPGALIQYDFSTEACLSSQDSFQNLGSLESTLSMLRNETATKCSLGMGVEATDLFLSNDVEDGVSHMKDAHAMEAVMNSDHDISGITFSLWIDIPEEDGGMVTGPVLAIGTPWKTIPSATTTCDERQLDFEISIRKNFLEVMYRTNDAFFEPCTRFQVTELPLSSGIHHLAVTLGENYQQIFINGQPSIVNRDPFSTKLENWNEESSIYLFSFPRYEYPAWDGHIYQFSIYSDLWDSARAKAEMVRGLPSSKPYALSQQIRMNEDAEATPGTHTIDWYRAPRTFDGSTTSSVPQIDLPIVFPQYEINVLLKTLNIHQESTENLKFYIIRPPSRGDLYDIDGSRVPTEFGVATALKGQTVIFLPFHNEHSELPGSVYSSFDFCVTTNAIFSPSQCESSGTLEILVDASNDPPVAKVGTPLYLVREGIYEEPVGLKLFGEDVDIGDEVAAIEVTSPPTFGFLYLSVPSRRDDGLLHGTPLSELNYTISGPEVFLEYRFTGSHQVVQGASVKDSFKFRVADSHGTWSGEKDAHIQVVSGLSIQPPSDQIIQENTSSLVRLQGRDESGLDRKTCFFFETVPNKKHGILVDGNGFEITKNTIVLTNMTEDLEMRELNLTFNAAPEACVENEAFQTNSTFSFRMVSLSAGGEISSASAAMQQQIGIICRLKPLRVLKPQDSYVANIYTGSAEDPCNGYNYNATTTDPSLCPAAVIIDGMKIMGTENHKEDVKVTVSSSNGLLTINRNKRTSMQAIEGQEEMRSSIAFLAHPADLEEVLSHLHYQTEAPGIDQIKISIQCPDDPVTRSDCQDVVVSIQVEALASGVAQPARLYRDFPWFSLSFTLTMVCLFKSKGKLRKFIDKWNAQKIEDELYKDCAWREHYDSNSGFYYYENRKDGSVTWHAHIDEGIIPSPERGIDLSRADIAARVAPRNNVVHEDDDYDSDDEPSVAETTDDNSSIGDSSIDEML